MSHPRDPATPRLLPKRRGFLKWLVFAVLAAVTVGGGLAYYKSKNKPPGPERFVVKKVTRGDVIERIEATGTVQPLVKVEISSQVNGRAKRVLVDYNARVHRGDLLLELDDAPYQAQVAQTRAAVRTSQAQLQRARADLALAERVAARAEALRQQDLNTAADLDQARGALDVSRAQVAAAQAQAAQAQASLASQLQNLAYTKIYAPIDGVVISRAVEPGQTVVSSFQAPVLFVIANDLSRMQVLADVDEADVGRLREEMRAEVRVDAFAGETFRGLVRQLRFGPNSANGVVTYPAVVEVANPDLKLRPGMTATVTIVTASERGVVRVPNAALRYRPNARQDARVSASPRGARTRVYVLRGAQPQGVDVRVGITDGTYTQILDGLQDGQQVVVDEADGGEGAGPGAPGGGSGGGRRGPRMF